MKFWNILFVLDYYDICFVDIKNGKEDKYEGWILKELFMMYFFNVVIL